MTAITAWAQDVAVRAIKTFAQALAGMLGVGAINVLHVDWRVDLAVAGGAALACVLQNVSSFPTPRTDPLTPAEIAASLVALNAAQAALTPSAPATPDYAPAMHALATVYAPSVPPVAPADGGFISGPSGPLAPTGPSVVIGDVVPTVAGPPTVLSSNTFPPAPPVAG